MKSYGGQMGSMLGGALGQPGLGQQQALDYQRQVLFNQMSQHMGCTIADYTCISAGYAPLLRHEYEPPMRPALDAQQRRERITARNERTRALLDVAAWTGAGWGTSGLLLALAANGGPDPHASLVAAGVAGACVTVLSAITTIRLMLKAAS